MRSWLVIVVCLALSLAAEVRSNDGAPRAQAGGNLARENVDQVAPVFRDGSQIKNATGVFRRNGDRLDFVMAGGVKLTTLENLNLERIEDKLSLDTGALSWTVSGTVTVYRDQFYLLISRAKARRTVAEQSASAPAPANRPVR